MPHKKRRKDMRTQTILYKEESKKDIRNIRSHSMRKDLIRTDAQFVQSRNDKMNFYFAKWTEMLDNAETKAQASTCKKVLARI